MPPSFTQISCFKRDIDGQNKLPEDTVTQVDNSPVTLSDSLQQLASSITGVADAHNRAMLTFLGGNRLNRELFYILLATISIQLVRPLPTKVHQDVPDGFNTFLYAQVIFSGDEFGDCVD